MNTRVPQLLQMEEANELFSLQVAALVSRMDVALEVTSRQLGNKEFELEHVYRSFARYSRLRRKATIKRVI